MIRLKLGKRIGAITLFLLLCFNLALPVFASSGQLETVGWAETVSTFLMASGIYPYNDDEQVDFSSWSADNLTALYNQFVDEVDSGVVSVEQAVTDFLDAGKSIARLTSSLIRGVVAIVSGRWSVLRAFATWIVDKYSVTDSQSNIVLGSIAQSSNGAILNFWASSLSPSISDVRQNGISINFTVGHTTYYLPTLSGVFVGRVPNSSVGGGLKVVFAVKNRADWNPDVYKLWEWWSTINSPWTYYFNTLDSYSNVRYYDTNAVYVSSSIVIPLYDSLQEFLNAVGGVDGAIIPGDSGGLHGIVADTTAVSVPDALPQDSQFGGLSVQGAGQGVTVEQLQELIRDAVQDALKPSVSVTPVVVAPNVDVSADGKINADLEIDNQDVPLTSSDYSAPNLTKVFPFSIPWDIVNVLQVFNAEPVRPDFQADVYIPVVDVHVPFHIGVTDDLSEGVDNAMQLWRNMLLVLMCAGTLWLFWLQLH